MIIWTSSDRYGDFEFLNIPYGKYKITVSCIGFNDQQIEVNYIKDHTRELEIQLIEHIEELEAVVVTHNILEAKKVL